MTNLTKTTHVTAALAAFLVTLTAGPMASADSVVDSICFQVEADAGDTALVNLTPVAARADGFGRLTTSPAPAAGGVSNVNFAPGSIDPNVGLATVGADQQVCFVNGSDDRVHLVADHLGSIAADSFEPASATGSIRVVDTRSGLGGERIVAGERRCFTVDGAPGNGAVVNLTPVRAAAPGNGQLASSEVSSPPVTSNVNYRPGVIDPNVAIAPIGADGRVCFVNADLSDVDLVADHLGTISTYYPAASSGASVRVADTRVGVGGSRVAAGGTLCFAVSGEPGDAAVLNLTPVRASAVGSGSLVAAPASAVPAVSNVNYRPESIDPNVAIAPIGFRNEVCFVNSDGSSVDLVADQIGTIEAAAYSPATEAGTPSRRIDTRTTASRADLVLASRGVGYAGFGGTDSSAITYVESGLGEALYDVRTVFPVDAGDAGYRTDDDGENSYFAFPFSRQVGFDNGFELTFGGSASTELRLVGWSQDSFLVVDDVLVESVSAPLRTIDDITLGSRGSDHATSIVVNNGGCYSTGSGSTNGIFLHLESDGIPFLEIIGDGPEFRLNTPPLDDVTVIGLSAGEQVVPFGDC